MQGPSSIPAVASVAGLCIVSVLCMTVKMTAHERGVPAKHHSVLQCAVFGLTMAATWAVTPVPLLSTAQFSVVVVLLFVGLVLSAFEK